MLVLIALSNGINTTHYTVIVKYYQTRVVKNITTLDQYRFYITVIILLISRYPSIKHLPTCHFRSSRFRINLRESSSKFESLMASLTAISRSWSDGMKAMFVVLQCRALSWRLRVLVVE